jgi:3-hydroxybutyryl-CoA dehydrogenase
MSEFRNTAVLGAGVIGMSWAALFLASGRNVAVFDTVANAEQSTRDYIDMAWPALRELGLIKPGASAQLSFHKSAADAVRDADFVQESVPERIDIKRALFAEIEPALKPNAIVASSASSGRFRAMWQTGFRPLCGERHCTS